MSGKNKWSEEFNEFASSEAEVPVELTKRVTGKIERLLNPRATSVFTKVAAIHIVVGFVSLLFCHQFELNPFHTNISLADWFMSVGGHSVCMISCGVLFVGLSILASGYFLTLEETRSLRNTGFPQSFALASLSLILFATAGAEIALTFAGLWLLGALIGGFLATEAIYQLKFARVQRL